MELKNCPFCGRKAIVWGGPAVSRYRAGYRVSCESDCLSMPSRPDISFTSEESAIKAWNTRADGWIRADKRLPEKRQKILALFNNMMMSIDHVLTDNNYWFNGVRLYELDIVTHWMPRPEPP